MKSAICTLFERDYHFGLGALVNSLYCHGFRGVIWAGFRGALPSWAAGSTNCQTYHEFKVAEGVTIRFIPLSTEVHFTLYKPDFMLRLIERYSSDFGALFYIDPDILITTRWTFFDGWVCSGIALCEDVNSPMHSTHPTRFAWKSYFEPRGIAFCNELDAYVNGGFVGVTAANFNFLKEWQHIQQCLFETLGKPQSISLGDRTSPFDIPDQDALNISLQTTHFPFSIMGREAMGFIPGASVMCHAIGSKKPWRRKLLLEALSGLPPTSADKEYLRNTQSPIRLYTSFEQRLKQVDARIGAAVGRFIRRT